MQKRQIETIEDHEVSIDRHECDSSHHSSHVLMEFKLTKKLKNDKTKGKLIKWSTVKWYSHFNPCHAQEEFVLKIKVIREEKEPCVSGFNLRTKKESSERWTQGKKKPLKRRLQRLLKDTTPDQGLKS